jgi:hypothetical protein
LGVHRVMISGADTLHLYLEVQRCAHFGDSVPCSGAMLRTAGSLNRLVDVSGEMRNEHKTPSASAGDWLHELHNASVHCGACSM